MTHDTPNDAGYANYFGGTTWVRQEYGCWGWAQINSWMGMQTLGVDCYGGQCSLCANNEYYSDGQPWYYSASTVCYVSSANDGTLYGVVVGYFWDYAGYYASGPQSFTPEHSY